MTLTLVIFNSVVIEFSVQVLLIIVLTMRLLVIMPSQVFLIRQGRAKWKLLLRSLIEQHNSGEEGEVTSSIMNYARCSIIVKNFNDVFSSQTLHACKGLSSPLLNRASFLQLHSMIKHHLNRRISQPHFFSSHHDVLVYSNLHLMHLLSPWCYLARNFIQKLYGFLTYFS